MKSILPSYRCPNSTLCLTCHQNRYRIGRGLRRISMVVGSRKMAKLTMSNQTLKTSRCKEIKVVAQMYFSPLIESKTTAPKESTSPTSKTTPEKSQAAIAPTAQTKTGRAAFILKPCLPTLSASSPSFSVCMGPRRIKGF